MPCNEAVVALGYYPKPRRECEGRGRADRLAQSIDDKHDQVKNKKYSVSIWKKYSTGSAVKNSLEEVRLEFHLHH